ncbi:MAG: HpaII family restriction endonuclease [Defluviitaleaceae bacterium]|nr:HpaII family restriction endonuclease [Defluviitaleaceae bacterium]
MPITGNKGEWSETYAFLRLLADGKLFAADEQLNRIGDMFFPILKIIREETRGTPYEYHPDADKAEVRIYLNDEQVLCLPATVFDEEAKHLFGKIATGTSAFEVAKTEAFIRKIFMTKLKTPSADKSDISVQIHDVHTGYRNVVGFSIKSELGSPPTLLNAGRTTNFIYEVTGLNPSVIAEINAIETKNKLINRMTAIADNGGKLSFVEMENNTFSNNLTMIDSQMPVIVAEMLIGYYMKNIADSMALTDYVSQVNPLSCNMEFYKHKIKDLLCAIALGMKPATAWDGTDEASGGYIIVKTDGDVLAYHIYNRDAFRGYLLKNTQLEKGSSSRHGFCTLYESGGKIFIKLNLQIRFS